MTHTMRLVELLPDVDGIPVDLVVSGLVQDSREINAGDAFVAIGGFGAHGLGFVDAAKARGASAVLFEPPAPEEHPAPAEAIAVPGLRSRLGEMAHRFHGRATESMTVVGVTGTNGKTSTVQLIAQAWTLRGVTAGTVGTLGVGLYGHAVPTGFTTPLVLKLHSAIGEMRADGAEALAMEVSSHALDQGRVDGVRFDVAAFTNLTRDHLDYHGTMAAYGAAKARLFGWPGLKAAVVNLDDEYGAQLFDALPSHVRGIGVSSRAAANASLQADAITLDAGGIAFDLVSDGARAAVRSPLLGRFNVDNLLTVAGVLHALGADVRDVADTLSRLQPIHGRMNRLGDAGQPLVVIDYAHTPDALEQALSTLRAHTAGRLVCVFGCGGERDTGKRPQMGAIAEKLADIAIVTDDNPRGEDGDAIVANILEGFADRARATVMRDRRAAIRHAVQGADEHDVVLIAGKGHEPYQEIAGVKHPFDDTRVAREALEIRA
ncbi:UDP-N-acetylmuramoyl-L-alanyl-D-glutamate--2,6-diaminopimelate ligase [Lysobacter sp. HA18]